MPELLKAFMNPTAAYRGKPFWAWNGKLDKAELLRQVHVLKAMGFGGFFMHSRTGLVTDYLGEAWFDLINACADEAEKVGLEAWLYDEDRWPSGLAGGIVTEDERWQGRSVRLEILEASAWPTAKAEGVVGAFFADVDGLAFTEAERLTEESVVRPEETRKLLLFTVFRHEKRTFHNGQTYLDTLNPDATRAFLDVTHEQYKTHCGERFGGSIKGVFTDEPHRGALMDGFSMADAEPTWTAPWTDTLPDRYRDAFGGDLIDALPDIFLQRGGNPVSPAKWRYVELLQRMFLDGYIIPCDRWCRENDLILTGHMLHEDSLAAQTAMCGSALRVYEHMQYPGVDVLTEGNRNYWIVKQLASAARQTGATWLMSELYGCTGWQMPFAGHKAVGDWQALLGINLRCHHLSWFTTEGEAKRDYPASIFHQSAWWESYGPVETYFSRIGVLMGHGTPACDVLVVHPVESMWCQICPGWSRNLTTKVPALVEIEKGFADLFHWLSGAQIDFDYGDEEMLGRLGSVEESPDGPRLRVGEAVYKVAVVGRMATVRASTLALLKQFADAGGAVIFAGDPPPNVDAERSGAAAALAAESTRTAFARDAVVDAVDEAAGIRVRVTGEDGSPRPQVFCQVRDADDVKILMALNTDRDTATGPCRLRLRKETHADQSLEHWNCLTSERENVPTTQHGEFLEWTDSFDAAGEHLYVLRGAADPALPTRRTFDTVDSQEIPGPFRYRLGESNVCVLDIAAHKIDGGTWSPPMEILKADRAIRDHLNLPKRGGDMLQPWLLRRQGRAAEVAGRVDLKFEFEVDVLPAGPVQLAMENPAGFSVRLNGHAINPVADAGWWIDRSLRLLPVPPAALRRGRNFIHLQTEFRADTNPEAIFLLGTFGVEIDGNRRVLTDLPHELNVGDVAAQRLPFYSGPIVYEVPTPAAPDKDQRRYLVLPSVGGACVKVSAHACPESLLPWPPFEQRLTAVADVMDVAVVLTRRNTLGPLHESPPNRSAVGPGNFTTTGERFSDECVLEPAGLLAAPRIETRKAARVG